MVKACVYLHQQRITFVVSVNSVKLDDSKVTYFILQTISSQHSIFGFQIFLTFMKVCCVSGGVKFGI